MENHNFEWEIRNTHSKWPFSIAVLNYQMVPGKAEFAPMFSAVGDRLMRVSTHGMGNWTCACCMPQQARALGPIQKAHFTAGKCLTHPPFCLNQAFGQWLPLTVAVQCFIILVSVALETKGHLGTFEENHCPFTIFVAKLQQAEISRPFFVPTSMASAPENDNNGV